MKIQCTKAEWMQLLSILVADHSVDTRYYNPDFFCEIFLFDSQLKIEGTFLKESEDDKEPK